MSVWFLCSFYLHFEFSFTTNRKRNPIYNSVKKQRLLRLGLRCLAQSHDKSAVVERTAALHSVGFGRIRNVNINGFVNVVNDIAEHCVRVNAFRAICNNCSLHNKIIIIIIIIIIMPWTIFIVLSSTAPAIRESSLWVIWTKVSVSFRSVFAIDCLTFIK